MSSPTRLRPPRAPSLDDLSRALSLTTHHDDERCPCDACVARDLDLATAITGDRARRAADEAAALAKHGPAVSAEALGFAPVAVDTSHPRCSTIERLRRELLGVR